MPILTQDDLKVLLPGICIEQVQLYALQAFLESPLVANRPLEPTLYSEIKALRRAGSECHFSYLPVDYVSPITVEVRQRDRPDSWGRRGLLNSWQQLSVDDYQIESELDLLLVDWHSGLEAQARVAYTAGIDFTLDTVRVRGLKAAAIALLQYQISNAGKGLASFRVEGEFAYTYARSPNPQSTPLSHIPESLLYIFKRYRPIDIV
jgi:hypothetical protein